MYRSDRTEYGNKVVIRGAQRREKLDRICGWVRGKEEI